MVSKDSQAVLRVDAQHGLPLRLLFRADTQQGCLLA
jgi:hypothetical protein